MKPRANSSSQREIAIYRRLTDYENISMKIYLFIILVIYL